MLSWSSSSRMFWLSGVLARWNGVQQHQHPLVDGQSSSGDQQHDQRRHGQVQHSTPWRQFTSKYYDDISHLDAVFYLVHLLMSAVHKRVLVTSREQLPFQVAMLIFAGALLMRLLSRPLYARVRPQLVFLVHIALTILRASTVYTMASKQAVHFRVGMLAEEKHTAGILVLTMLAILGGPFRLFEMLGLQQPWALHALVSILYLTIHPWAAMDGIRLAYSNAMFMNVHAVHDAVSAVFDALLQGLTGLPTGQQQTCSSCAGAVVYGFMCLFGSVAVPLYILYVRELAAYRHWVQQTANTAAAADRPGAVGGGLETATAAGLSTSDRLASAGEGVASSSNLAADAPAKNSQRRSNLKSQRQHLLAQSEASSSAAGSSSISGSSAMMDTRSGRPVTRMELIEQQAEAVAAALPTCEPWPHSLTGALSSSNFIVRWFVHALVLVCLLIGCWLVSNAVALMLLPRVLSSQQLDRWCPNRPYAPYVIAGQVYDGL